MSIYKPMASMYVHRVLHCPIAYDFRIPAKDGVGLGVQVLLSTCRGRELLSTGALVAIALLLQRRIH